MRGYPIGLQDFRQIREADGLYIDKTEYVYRMAHALSKYYFLSRPRRFGKTLLTSTLQYYFEGQKELFEGLYIGEHETEWEAYPVLRFDMSLAKKKTKEDLRNELSRQLEPYEKRYGCGEYEKMPGQRFAGIIRRAYEKTGKKVVVLIDEYDAPLLEVITDDTVLDDIRYEMRDFYGILKPSDPYLRFVFLTGITKFSQLSIFSGLNNIENISMDEEYAAICGITRSELENQMQSDIAMLGEKMGLTAEKTLEKLVANYDGYHFTWPSDDIFNPYSLMLAFKKKHIGSYWFESATSTHLIEMLRKYNVNPSDLGTMMVKEIKFNTPIEGSNSFIPLFYQSGYLTIKGYNADNDRYVLGIPNNEVQKGLTDELSAYYLPSDEVTDDTVDIIRESLANDDIEAALTAIGEELQMIPYTENIDYEGHYQQIIYLLFQLAGAEVDAEKRTANGRIDIVVRTKSRLYILELKMDNTAEAAMSQIRRKKYESRFAKCGLPIVKVGVNIDSKQRTINQLIVKSE